MQQIYYFINKKQEIVDFLREIVTLESPSTDKKAVNRCSAFVVENLKESGAKIKKFKQKKSGDYFLAEIGKGERKILVLTHVDTVWRVGKISEMPFKIEKDRIFGPGVFDMKGGITMFVFALKAINELKLKPKSKIMLFINSEEEISSKNSKKYIEKFAKESDYVLCLEPALPGGAVKTRRKGVLTIKIESFGKSVHSGLDPQKGINAIEELLTQLSFINKLREKGVSANIGKIIGGERVNIIPDKAQAFLDIRFWEKEKIKEIENFFDRMKPSVNGAKIHWEKLSFTPPMERTRDSQALFLKAKKIAEILNINLKQGDSGGGSDASFASYLGIPTIDGLGPNGDGAHSENEHIIVSSLIERTALLTELLCNL
ncbi:MAG: M20 family metallopeptidase [Acidobacteriota bacterium]